MSSAINVCDNLFCLLFSLPTQADETMHVEREEGEISDAEELNGGEFEYEAISSDEESTLREKIEALEARNLELEKIASISARAHDPYGKKLGYFECIYFFKLMLIFHMK